MAGCRHAYRRRPCLHERVVSIDRAVDRHQVQTRPPGTRCRLGWRNRKRCSAWFAWELSRTMNSTSCCTKGSTAPSRRRSNREHVDLIADCASSNLRERRRQRCGRRPLIGRRVVNLDLALVLERSRQTRDRCRSGPSADDIEQAVNGRTYEAGSVRWASGSGRPLVRDRVVRIERVLKPKRGGSSEGHVDRVADGMGSDSV